MTPHGTNRRPIVLLLALLCAIALTGCGGGTKTGSGVDLKASGKAGNLFPTTAPPKARPTTAPPKARPTTARPQQTQPAAPPFVVTLNGDKSGKPLVDPPQAAVYSGTKVVFKNADSKPHGVVAQNGAFNSGNIAPGGSFTWLAAAPGNYAYQDTTRPYVNASIQVAPR